MPTFITNSKWRWLTASMLMAASCFIGIFLLNAASPSENVGVKSELGSTFTSATGERSASHITSPSVFTFNSPTQLARPLSPVFFQQGGEPEIKIDNFGDIYVTAIQGVPGGVDLWKSKDNGASFVYLGQPDGAQDHCSTLPQCAGLGGADDSIDVSPGGYLYVSSLWVGNVTVSTSMDGGTGGVQPGQAWSVNGAAATVVSDDRQWIAAYGPTTLNMTYRMAPGTGDLFFAKSTDAGKTFGAPVLVRTGDSTEGNLVVDPYNGNLYTTTIPSNALTDIHLLKSTDGGATWTETTAYAGPAGSDPGHKFTILAIDRGGNLHLVFGRSNSGGGYHVYLTSSANGGTSWLPPVQVDSGSGNTTTAVMPWVAAGSPGVVDITWIGSSGISPTVAPFNWQVFFAQTTNALSGSPVFNQVQATTNAIHDTNICFNGSGCTGTDNRDLLEYYTMALDPEGNASIAFADSVNNCPTATCKTNAWYMQQASGTKAYAPPAAPAPATFSANIPIGSPGAEPSLWVDSHNCIFVSAPGNPWSWKSVNNGASFLPPVNPVADEATLTGGDEDVITLSKPDGTRPDQVYYTDLGLTSDHIRKSTDGGTTFFKPGPGGSAGDTGISSDRQWLAVDRIGVDQYVYEVDHELATEIIRLSGSANDNPWVTQTTFVDPELATTVPNTNPGPTFVDKQTHKVYGIFNASIPTNNIANPPFGKLLNIWLFGADAPAVAGGVPGNFANYPVFKGTIDSATTPAPPAGTETFGTNNANIFPAGDIDAAGNIYAVWSMNNARTNEFSVWFASSHDHGKTFYGPFPVSSGSLAPDETAVLPWVAAGDDGRVDIVYYKTPVVGDPNTLPTGTNGAPWNMFFAQSLNAASREPVFTNVQASDHIMHQGQISTGGLIGTSDRSLLDYFEVSIGPDGLANIAYADNGSTATHAEFTRQTGGPIAKINPTFPTCLEQVGPPLPVSAVSRKTHASAGDFDVNLLVPPTPPPGVGVECRTGGPNGDFKIVIAFAVTVTVDGNPQAQVVSGTGTVSNVTVNGAVVTVDLTGVSNAQTITLRLFTVNDGTNSGNVDIRMGVLLGDTTANGSTNSSDVSEVKAQSGTATTQSNFRTDVTVNGVVNSSDVSTTKLVSGTALP